MEAVTTYRPQGHRHLGLWAAEVGRFSAASSAARLRERLERAEHRTGVAGFSAEGLDRLPAALAFELAHGWLGLRRAWPGVVADRLEASVPLGPLLGMTQLYAVDYPELHRAQRHHCDQGATGPVGADGAPGVSAHGCPAPLSAGRAGVVQLSSCLGHPRCYRATGRLWERRAATAARRGTTPYVPAFRSTLATLVLVHEWAHLVEAAVWDVGAGVAERVYEELSAELLGTRPHSTRQWRDHLANYPSWSLPSGPHQPSGERRRAQRRSLRAPVGARLGRYALVSREELFAESLAFAVCGTDAGLAACWRRIRGLLADEGITRRPR